MKFRSVFTLGLVTYSWGGGLTGAQARKGWGRKDNEEVNEGGEQWLVTNCGVEIKGKKKS